MIGITFFIIIIRLIVILRKYIDHSSEVICDILKDIGVSNVMLVNDIIGLPAIENLMYERHLIVFRSSKYTTKANYKNSNLSHAMYEKRIALSDYFLYVHQKRGYRYFNYCSAKSKNKLIQLSIAQDVGLN